MASYEPTTTDIAELLHNDRATSHRIALHRGPVTAVVLSLNVAGGFAIKLLDDFHHYLADHGVTLAELSRKESFAITKRWTSIFAALSDNLHETQGLKAIDKWLKITDSQLILLFLSAGITAFPISENSRSCTAYSYTGRILDLSAYNQLEFAVVPETYEWTLIHTHEDGAFGGPYFIRNEGTPPTRDRTKP